MDPERDLHEHPLADPPPADADIVPSADPDPELAAAYAAWWLDRAEDRP
jgi:hypothetical protein